MGIQDISFSLYLLAMLFWYFIKGEYCQKVQKTEKIFTYLPLGLDFLFIGIVLGIKLLKARKEEKKILMNRQYKNLIGER